ncbi:MAG: T9SS type A sorting domain-containing protein [Saprospiraceae bacterium]
MKYFKLSLLLNICCFFFSQLSFGQLVVKGGLHIQSEALLYVACDIDISTAEGNIENEGKVELMGSLTKDQSSTYGPTTIGINAEEIVFKGASISEISGNFEGSNAIHNLTIDKASTLSLLNDIEVNNQLRLLNGVIKTTDTGELYISNSQSNALSGNISVASPGNFINGNLKRAVSMAGVTYEFPVGMSENEPAHIRFNDTPPVSDITARFSPETITGINTEVDCSDMGIGIKTIDCVLGHWNISANDQGYDYNISLFPGEMLKETCSEAALYYVSKDGMIDVCPDQDLVDGINSSSTEAFGIFEIATAAAEIDESACGAPRNITATKTGQSAWIIEWDKSPNANSHVLQIRFKGTTRWLVTAKIGKGSKVYILSPQREYEYRIKTICIGEESVYSEVQMFTLGPGIIGKEEITKDLDSNIPWIKIRDTSREVELFPNPFSSDLFIAFNTDKEHSTLFVHDISGKLLLEKSLQKGVNHHNLNLSRLPDGFYIASINLNGETIFRKKIIKKR